MPYNRAEVVILVVNPFPLVLVKPGRRPYRRRYNKVEWLSGRLFDGPYRSIEMAVKEAHSRNIVIVGPTMSFWFYTWPAHFKYHPHLFDNVSKISLLEGDSVGLLHRAEHGGTPKLRTQVKPRP